MVDSLKIRNPFHLLGLSFGVPICAEFINRNSSLVNTLTLIDPLVTTVPLETNRWFKYPILGELYMALYFAPIILPRSQSGDFYQPDRFPGWEEKFQEQIRYKGFRYAILSTYRQISKFATAEIYKGISEKNVPVQIIWGKEDKTIKISDIEELRHLNPDSKFFAIERAGHIPHFELPGKVNPLLINFFNQK